MRAGDRRARRQREAALAVRQSTSRLPPFASQPWPRDESSAMTTSPPPYHDDAGRGVPQGGERREGRTPRGGGAARRSCSAPRILVWLGRHELGPFCLGRKDYEKGEALFGIAEVQSNAVRAEARAWQRAWSGLGEICHYRHRLRGCGKYYQEAIEIRRVAERRQPLLNARVLAISFTTPASRPCAGRSKGHRGRRCRRAMIILRFRPEQPRVFQHGQLRQGGNDHSRSSERRPGSAPIIALRHLLKNLGKNCCCRGICAGREAAAVSRDLQEGWRRSDPERTC